MWEFDRKSKFKKQFKLLGSVRQERIKEALLQLGNSEKPDSLGAYKQSMKVYSYEVGRGDRIVYTVDCERHTIVLVRVGDHKMTYGKD